MLVQCLINGLSTKATVSLVPLKQILLYTVAVAVIALMNKPV